MAATTEKQEPGWLIVMTKPNSEIDVLCRLRKQGFRVWHWHCMRDEPSGDRRRRVSRRAMRSYLSRYLFVREDEAVDLINQTEGVSTTVNTPQGPDGDPLPVIISNASLQSLATYLGVSEDGYVPEREPEAPPMLPAGAMVRDVELGIFARVARSAPLDGKTKIRGFTEFFGRVTAVELDQRHMEVIDA